MLRPFLPLEGFWPVLSLQEGPVPHTESVPGNVKGPRAHSLFGEQWVPGLMCPGLVAPESHPQVVTILLLRGPLWFLQCVRPTSEADVAVSHRPTPPRLQLYWGSGGRSPDCRLPSTLHNQPCATAVGTWPALVHRRRPQPCSGEQLVWPY